ncbi:MAG: Gfo/Idh/MocA family protein, partial [Bacilli bacterium]
MKIAIVGTGEVAQWHIKALQEMGLTINIVCSNDINSATVFAKKHHIPNVCNSIESLFSLNFDVLHICTPPTSHYEYAYQALSNRKHVVCEKPLCL